MEKISGLYNNLKQEVDQISDSIDISTKVLDLDLKERQLFEHERISAEQRNQIEQLQSQFEKEKLSSICLLDKLELKDADLLETRQHLEKEVAAKVELAKELEEKQTDLLETLRRVRKSVVDSDDSENEEMGDRTMVDEPGGLDCSENTSIEDFLDC